MRAQRTILVVDDDRDLRESLREMLEDHGHVAVDVEDGVQALAYLRAHDVALVLLDWHLVRMSAPALQAALADDPVLCRVPLVIISADLRLEREALAAFAGHLRKPIDLVTLFELVERYCD